LTAAACEAPQKNQWHSWSSRGQAEPWSPRRRFKRDTVCMDCTNVCAWTTMLHVHTCEIIGRAAV
jgi:hypothetical protein